MPHDDAVNAQLVGLGVEARHMGWLRLVGSLQL